MSPTTEEVNLVPHLKIIIDEIRNSDNTEDRQSEDLYTVVCGYEYEPVDIVRVLDESDMHPHLPQVIADRVSMTSAQHLVRSLNEHGEPDMCYWMLPHQLYRFFQESAFRPGTWPEASEQADREREAFVATPPAERPVAFVHETPVYER